MDTRTAVLEALFEESATVREIVQRIGRSASSVRRALSWLSDENLVSEGYSYGPGPYGQVLMYFVTTVALERRRKHDLLRSSWARAQCPPDPTDDPDGALRSDSSMKSGGA